jgi:hypothetical protein
MRILSSREKTVIALTLTVTLGSLLYNFLIGPLLDKNKQLDTEINFVRSKLVKYRRLLKQQDGIRQVYDKYASDLKLADVGQDALVSILSELEAFAQSGPIRILDIRPQNTPQKAVQVDLRTEGTIEGYCKFMYDIENSSLILRIKRLQLTVKPNSDLLEGSFSIIQVSF